MAERVVPAGGEAEHNLAAASEQFARYTLATPLCTGKRVLDVSSGQGHGAAWLKASGASYVVGLVASEATLAAAASRFSDDDLEFRVGDASSGWRQPAETFDLIVCFETIEHVVDPQSLLQSLFEILTPGGAMLVSWSKRTADANGRYDLLEFKRSTEPVLGSASQWLVGTPFGGILNFDEGTTSPIDSGASFFIGVWNARLDTLSIVPPMSRNALLDLWAMVISQKRILKEMECDRSRLAKLAELADKRARDMRSTTEIEKRYLKKQLWSLTEKISALTQELNTYRNSRVHRIAGLYLQAANSRKPILRLLFFPRKLVRWLWRR